MSRKKETEMKTGPCDKEALARQCGAKNIQGGSPRGYSGWWG